MADKLTKQQRSRCMAAIRSKDTKPERIVRSIAHRLGLRFRLHAADLPGKPDFVLRYKRAVVFVHGCYWHMHNCKRGKSTPVTNAAFWKAKRTKNRERDRRTAAALRRRGWRVIAIWECQLRPDRIGAVIEVLEKLRRVGALPQRRPNPNSADDRSRSRTRQSRR